MKPRILTVGTVCTELVVHTDIIPTEGKTEKADKYLYVPGGDGTETSVALSRLGGESLLCARVGDDPNADDLKDYLKKEGVDTRFISATRGENSALSVKLTEMGRGSRRLFCEGASMRLSDSDIEDAFISYPDAVILDGDIPPQALSKVSKLVSEAKTPIALFVMSCAFPSSFAMERISGCEVFSLSSEETVAITGIDPADQERCMKACLAIMQRVNAKHIVLRLGDRGFFLYDGMYYDFVSAYDIIIPEGTDNGSIFAAALTLEYMRSEGDIKRATEYAAIACAVSYSRGGGLRSYPFEEDIRRFILRNGIDFKL